MGRDRNLPDAFGEIHPRTRTPYKALGWTAVLICVMVAFVPITTVAAAADIMFLLLFLQVNVAAITLRKKYGDKLAYGYIMPFFPVVPILGIVTELGLALFMFLHFPTAWLFVLLWLVAGGFIFRFYARGREREKTRPPIVAEERAVESKPHAILIPVADPESAKRHIRLGASMARKSDGALILLHVEKVPWQLPSSAASRFVRRSRKMMDEMRTYAEKQDVPASTMVRLARDPAEAIIFTAEETGCEFLIMGWQGDARGGQTMIGRNIDRVLKESNCHVIVVQRDKVRKGERIVVPVDHPTDAPLSLAVASHLRDDDSPPTTVLHLTEKPMSADEREAFRREIITQIRERAQKPEALFTDPDEFNIQFDVSRHPTAELVRKSSEFDRMVLGTSRSSFFGRKVFGRLPIRIARHAHCPVIFVRRKEHGIRFGIQRFFQFFRDIENEAAHN
jgi:nucleotide-binding universal stress UspA family protein